MDASKFVMYDIAYLHVFDISRVIYKICIIFVSMACCARYQHFYFYFFYLLKKSQVLPLLFGLQHFQDHTTLEKKKKTIRDIGKKIMHQTSY